MGGDLAAIELKRNPFDWSHDDTSDGAPLHALSATDGRYDLYGVSIRWCMTAMSVRVRSAFAMWSRAGHSAVLCVLI